MNTLLPTIVTNPMAHLLWKPTIAFSLWSDDERCITLNGKPTGQTVSRESAYAICQWLETAWPEIEALAKRLALEQLAREALPS